MRRKSSGIYFLQAGEAGLIKIGIAVDIFRRIPQLQTGCPHELRLLGTMKGDSRIEVQLHNQFKKHQYRGEWFRPAPEVIDFVFENATLYGFRGNLTPYLQEAVSLEKKILPILAVAAKQRNTNGYNRVGTYYLLKRDMERLVGWWAANPILRTIYHHEATILFMSDLLPSDNADHAGMDYE